MYEPELRETILRDIETTDQYSNVFKFMSIAIAVTLTCIGVLVSRGSGICDLVLLLCGIATAGLGTFNKLYDPSTKSEHLKLRKRSLELLSIEGAKKDPLFTQEEAERLMILAKQDAPRVYEAVLTRTMPSMV